MNVDDLEFFWQADQNLLYVRYIERDAPLRSAADFDRLALLWVLPNKVGDDAVRMLGGVFDHELPWATFAFPIPRNCVRAELHSTKEFVSPLRRIELDAALLVENCPPEADVYTAPFGFAKNGSGLYYSPAKRGLRHSSQFNAQTIQQFQNEFDRIDGVLADWVRFRIDSNHRTATSRIGPCQQKFRSHIHTIKISTEKKEADWQTQHGSQTVRHTFLRERRRAICIDLELPPGISARSVKDEIVFMHLTIQRAREDDVNSERKRSVVEAKVARAREGGGSVVSAIRAPLLDIKDIVQNYSRYALPIADGKEARLISLAQAIEGPDDNSAFQALGFDNSINMRDAPLGDANFIRVWFWLAAYIDLIGVAASRRLRLESVTPPDPFRDAEILSNDSYPQAEFVAQADYAKLDPAMRSFAAAVKSRALKRAANMIERGGAGARAETPSEDLIFRGLWVSVLTKKASATPDDEFIAKILGSPLGVEAVASSMDRLRLDRTDWAGATSDRRFELECGIFDLAPALATMGSDGLVGWLVRKEAFRKQDAFAAKRLEEDLGLVGAILARTGLTHVQPPNFTPADQIALWDYLLEDAGLVATIAARGLFVDAAAPVDIGRIRELLSRLEMRARRLDLYLDFVGKGGAPEVDTGRFKNLVEAFKRAREKCEPMALSDAVQLSELIGIVNWRLEGGIQPPLQPDGDGDDNDDAPTVEAQLDRIREYLPRVRVLPGCGLLAESAQAVLDAPGKHHALQIDQIYSQMRDRIGQGRVSEQADAIFAALAAWGDGDSSDSSAIVAPETPRTALFKKLQARAFHFPIPAPIRSSKLEFDRWRVSVRNKIETQINIAAQTETRPADSSDVKNVIHLLAGAADVALHVRAHKMIVGTLDTQEAGGAANEAAMRRTRRYLELWPQKSSECWEYSKSLAGRGPADERLKLSEPL